MYALDTVGAFKIEQPPETYIYDIKPIAREGAIAAISSDNCLRVVDPLALNGAPLHVEQGIHNEVTCLMVLEERNLIVCTAGRDGKVNIFDLRARSKVAELSASMLIISS